MSISLGNGEKIDLTLDIRTHRLLAKYEKQNYIRNTKLPYKESPNEENYKLTHGRDDNTYEQLKRGKPNYMEAYLKGYNQRYAKKKGLKRLDCYCERKFFKSLEKVMKHAEQKNISRKSIKKMLYKKYGLPLIIICLIPLFGLILPITFWNDDHITYGNPTTCRKLTSGRAPTFDAYNHEQCNLLQVGYVYLNHILLGSSIILILLLIIYLLVKFAKYERIKHGY
ncbi:Plasmodium exported protein, unknown function [Plasmodium vivax]|uniref:VIR protein n=1 Tax=Plasmodium vivax TaxID=5855 RepID=A0A1G4H734_PLAVI|nr:Plasmodium exported protein, unknown function [Plasmodium vivax]